MKGIGEKMTDEQLDIIFNKADTDGDGRIDYTGAVKIKVKTIVVELETNGICFTSNTIGN